MGAVAVLGAALTAAMPAVGNVEVAEAMSAWVPEFCGRGEFAKYGKLTDKQVRKLAALCYIEGGDANGAADVASIMANRYELYGKKKYKNLYKYVRSSGWWFLASEMDEEKAPAKAIAVVSAVLKDGKRTLPGFIDEYDRLGDIKSLSNGKSPMKRKSYSKGVKVGERAGTGGKPREPREGPVTIWSRGSCTLRHKTAYSAGINGGYSPRSAGRARGGPPRCAGAHPPACAPARQRTSRT